MISFFDKKFTLLFTKLISNYDSLGISVSNTNMSLMTNIIYPYFKQLLEDKDHKIAKINKEFIDDDYYIWIIKYTDEYYNAKSITYNDIDEFRSKIQISNTQSKDKLVYDFIIPYKEEKSNEFKIKNTTNYFIDSRYIKFLNTEVNKGSLNDTINLFYYILYYINDKNPINSPNLYLYDSCESKDHAYNKIIMCPNSITFSIYENVGYKEQSSCLVAAIYHMYKILMKQDYFGGDNIIENMYNNSKGISTTFKSTGQFRRIMEKIDSI